MRYVTEYTAFTHAKKLRTKNSKLKTHNEPSTIDHQPIKVLPHPRGKSPPVRCVRLR